MILVGVYAKTEKSLGENGNTLPWYMDPANLFIIIGSIVFFLAFLGCIGSLRENVCLLRTVSELMILNQYTVINNFFLDNSNQFCFCFSV